MLTPPHAVPPPLQAPGAGLPKVELWVARLMVGWQARRSTRASATALFAGERAVLLALARGVDPAEGGRRVLIRRLPGLEDSSRFWSVFMTLDHLRIVNAGTAELIALLARGGTPARVTGTAEVKPLPEADETAIPEFERACDHFEQSVAAVAELHTAQRWPHPWFGPLDAANWHFFMAFHMRLHRRQMETILSTRQAAV